MGGAQLIVIQFHLLLVGQGVLRFLLQAGDLILPLFGFLEQFLLYLGCCAAAFGQHGLAEVVFLQQVFHGFLIPVIGQHHQGLAILAFPVGLPVGQQVLHAFLERRQFLVRKEAHMAVGRLREAQLFQGDIQLQPGLQAFGLGPERRRFTFQGSDLTGCGIQLFRQPFPFPGFLQEIRIGNLLLLGEQGILRPVLDQELEHRTGLIQLGADSLGPGQGPAPGFRFQHDAAVFLQGQQQGIAIGFQGIER